jgi:glycosyltransferase involved in cell wall biosynthesis
MISNSKPDENNKSEHSQSPNSELISMIVTCYNKSKLLPSTIESLIGQTNKNIEIICIDDGSSDDSLDILRKYAGLDSRITVVTHTEHKSLFQARRSGLRVAKGEFVIFVEVGDCLRLDSGELLLKAIFELDSDFLQFGVEVVDDVGHSESEYLQYSKSLYCKRLTVQFPNILDAIWRSKFYSTMVRNKIFKIDLLRENLLTDDLDLITNDYLADNLMFNFIISDLTKISSIPSNFLYHLWSSNPIEVSNISDRNFENVVQDSKTLVESGLKKANRLNKFDRKIWFENELVSIFNTVKGLFERIKNDTPDLEKIANLFNAFVAEWVITTQEN